jgi:hypothetical protein
VSTLVELSKHAPGPSGLTGLQAITGDFICLLCWRLELIPDAGEIRRAANTNVASRSDCGERSRAAELRLVFTLAEDRVDSRAAQVSCPGDC